MVQIDAETRDVTVDLGGGLALLPAQASAWVRPRSGGRAAAGHALAVGDVVEVEVRPGLVRRRGSSLPQVALVPGLRAQGALVAIEPHSRAVRAMVGGMPADVGGFNRATQALRQPGSAFKPILYAAGLQAGAITPASICPDSPVVYLDPWTGKSWKPDNYESGRYDGSITYRTALQRSKNTCSVRLIQKLSPDPVLTMARALGIHSPLPRNLTLALGTGETTVIELCNAYASLAAAGQFAEPVLVRRVEDKQGQVLLEAASQSTAALPDNVAFILTSMMRSVIEGGTGSRAQMLGRPLAGKTGTSQGSRDAWFVGFAPQLAAAVWVGQDNNQPMGYETGASAALPGWVRFMGMALAGEAPQDFARPSDVACARIDARSGQLSTAADALEEVFVAGTEPKPNTAPLQSIYLEEEP
ncbi:MAG: hypothetical protein EON47_12665 [Acetobacteraceae bacterium]|nr:MAG: hypothetical protein EON47_12665 [Acetobacteraceae bacterium]